MKALLEVCNCAICSEDVPGFVMDTFRYTGVPTFTSPKSIAVGLTTSADAFKLVDESAWEFAPQPESPRLSPMAATPSAMATAQPAIRPLELFFVWETSG